MNSKILGLLALGLMVAPAISHAITVDISGSGVGGVDGPWNVTTVVGTASDLAATLDDQVWWGRESLALLFASTVGDGLQPAFSAVAGPFFATAIYGSGINAAVHAPVLCSPSTCNLTASTSGSFAFAVASRLSTVPEPGTLALFGLGLLGLGVTRRRAA